MRRFIRWVLNTLDDMLVGDPPLEPYDLDPYERTAVEP